MSNISIGKMYYAISRGHISIGCREPYKITITAINQKIDSVPKQMGADFIFARTFYGSTIVLSPSEIFETEYAAREAYITWLIEEAQKCDIEKAKLIAKATHMKELNISVAVDAIAQGQ
jgi:hypothetical protein